MRDGHERERGRLPVPSGGAPPPDAAGDAGGGTLRSGKLRVRRPPDEGATAEAHLEHHYEDMAKQTHGAQLGMWAFIASEALMFSALFAVFAGYRSSLTTAFREGATHTNLWLGSVNTVVLLAASFLVALAIHFIRDDDERRTTLTLAGAAALGAAFLGLKLWEYARHFREGIYPGRWYSFEHFQMVGAETFFNLYYIMTGLHAVHVLGGIGILGWLALRTRRRAYSAEYHTPLELGGMYWHFVDIVWLFLWPCFYLMR